MADISSTTGDTSDLQQSTPCGEQARDTSDIDLAVRNLRLLNLDLLVDWPAVCNQSFQGKSKLKDRIRDAEWVFFRLFELWDKRHTHSQLRAFFPPLEPLQSRNLRAGLYRELYELKKNGILSRECVLRKSTLDECKGDKFEELLLSFSSAVLRKVSLERSGISHDLSMPRLFAVAPTLDTVEARNLKPLITTHRALLSKFLSDKDQDRAALREFQQALKMKNSLLEERLTEATSSLEGLQGRSLELGIDLADVETQVREHWPESDPWLDTMFNVDAQQGSDAYLEDNFDRIWESALKSKPLKYEDNPKGLVATLQTRIETQQVRLDGWRTFQNQMSARMQVLSQTPRRTPARTPLRSSAVKSPSKSPTKSPTKSPYKMVQSPQVSARFPSGSPSKVSSKAFRYQSELRHLPKTESQSENTTAELDGLPSALSQPPSRTNVHAPLAETQVVPDFNNLTEDIKHNTSDIASEGVAFGDHMKRPITPNHMVGENASNKIDSNDFSPGPASNNLSLAERTQLTLARTQSQRQHAQSNANAKTPDHTTYMATTQKLDQNRSYNDRDARPISYSAAPISTPVVNRYYNGTETQPEDTPMRGNQRSNPFETPPFQNGSAVPGHIAVSTPITKELCLESGEVDDADCASVFKSRPKLKASPIGSMHQISPVPWNGNGDE